MKFKADLTGNGVNLLEKRFLQALDKMGKCHFPSPLSHLLNGDGTQSIAQFHKEALFEDCHISSQNEDRITFTVELSLLHRALRSIFTIYTEFGGSLSDAGGPGPGPGPTLNCLQIKLFKKLPPI